TAPTRRSGRRPYAVHFAALSDHDLVEVDSIPATSLPRTLLDIAPGSHAGQLERCLQRADEHERLDYLEVEEMLARSGAHPGRGRLATAMDLYRPDPELTRSGVERLFRDLVRDAGLPRPAMNFNVAGFELDAYWPDLRFCVELDVFETHGTRAS